MSNAAAGILFSENVAYLQDAQAAVYLGGGDRPAVRPSEPRPSQLANVGDYAYWGDDNQFPQKIIELYHKSTELPSLLEWKARAAQGKEVLAFTRAFNKETKKLEDSYCDDPEIFEFLNSIPTKRYLREAYGDFFLFWNVFPDLIKSASGNKIAYIGTFDASHCRWGKQNASGVIPECWISPDWGTSNVSRDKALILPVIDPYSWSAADMVRESADNRFVYPISYPSPGKTYYQLATWDGFRTSGWMAIAAEIPKFKQAIMKNQMHIKYLIRIPTNYWGQAYENWDEKTEEQKNTCKKEKLAEINKSLTDVTNAGKSILNEVGFAPDGSKLPGWEIEVIDDKMREGAYLEDSQEASAHLMRALGLDPTLVGQGPGRNMGAGSGSDKRVAFNLYCALQKPYRDIVLEPLQFIAKYNGWLDRYPTLTFKTVEVELETLDKAHTTSQEKAA
jgi:hypothetical protein